MYYRSLLLLSGDISLNPGPFHNHSQLDHDEWAAFKHLGLYFLQPDANGLLPKIDELRRTSKLTYAAVTGIYESKLDDSVYTSKIEMSTTSFFVTEKGKETSSLLYLKQS